jgi:MFS family permease
MPVKRPTIGGIVLAHIGDAYGRKVALLVSVIGMAGSTFTMGCLPTYAGVCVCVCVCVFVCFL